jgi:nicotinamide-nucleotide amidase
MGIGESDIVERLGSVADGWRGVGIAFYPRTPGVDLKLTHHGKDPRRIAGELDAAEADLRRILSRFVFAVGTVDLPQVVGEMLAERSLRLAVAESCTGGALAALITGVPGSSRYFERGVVAYANAVKVDLLDVPQAVLDDHGAVSEETARAMADGLRRRSGVDLVIATTGVAGPGGGTEAKPVGLVYTAIAAPDGTRVWQSRSPGTRELIVRRTTMTALHRLRLVLAGEA